MYNCIYSKDYVKKSKLLSNISKQHNKNGFLLNNLIGELYSQLVNIVPEKIARSASLNSRDAFEYFLDYKLEGIKLIVKQYHTSWSLCYKVYPSYLNYKKKNKMYEIINEKNKIIINLGYFYKKRVKKYCN